MHNWVFKKKKKIGGEFTSSVYYKICTHKVWQTRFLLMVKIPSNLHCLKKWDFTLQHPYHCHAPCHQETRLYWLLSCSFHRVEQQPICSYLEKIISKNMDLMEKKLTDYIDRQIQALQAHIDDRMVLLMDLLQNSKQNKISQAHYDSNEGFSNGER